MKQIIWLLGCIAMTACGHEFKNRVQSPDSETRVDQETGSSESSTGVTTKGSSQYERCRARLKGADNVHEMCQKFVEARQPHNIPAVPSWYGYEYYGYPY